MIDFDHRTGSPSFIEDQAIFLHSYFLCPKLLLDIFSRYLEEKKIVIITVMIQMRIKLFAGNYMNITTRTQWFILINNDIERDRLYYSSLTHPTRLRVVCVNDDIHPKCQVLMFIEFGTTTGIFVIQLHERRK